jgi:hypothetical protein
VVDQARAELELARQELVLRLADAYFAVLLAQDTVATLQSERAAIHEQLAAANRGYELGTANITDVRDAQARYDLVGAQQIVARNDLAARLEQLRLIINRTPGAPPPLRPGVVLSGPQPDDMEAWVQAAATDNLAVLAGQAALEVARLETRKARAARYPQLDMVASYGSSKSATINTVGLDLDERRIGLQMSMPIYSGGGLVARERETRNLLDKANADLDNARRNGMLNARQAYLNATAGLAEVGALEQALVSAQTALQANQRGLELGVRANIDVLNAQQQGVWRVDLPGGRRPRSRQFPPKPARGHAGLSGRPAGGGDPSRSWLTRKPWRAASGRVELVEYARSYEGRPLVYLVISSPANLARSEEIQAGMAALADPRGLEAGRRARLIDTLPGVAWLAYPSTATRAPVPMPRSRCCIISRPTARRRRAGCSTSWS